jgi:hypothetical protein
MSDRFQLNIRDIENWIKNSFIYAAPFLLVFLLAIRNGSDMKDALNILYLYALDVIIDITRKYVAGSAKT